MINVSTEFKELMKTRTDFKQYAEITLADGAVWALDDSDFRITSNSVKDGVDANGLPLGVVSGRTIKMTFQNTDEQFKDIAFLGAEIRLYLTFQLSATVEKIELGTFTVISPEDYGETISIQAVDNSWKLDKDYATGLSFPQTIGSMFRDACSRCSVPFESASFRNNDFVVDALPEDVGTFREVIGYIAMIAGGNARFNRSGKLEILTYEFPAFDVEEEKNYDGGTFDDWDSGDTLDGGTFDDWASGDDADGGVFDPWDSSSGSGGGNIVVDDDTHVLTNWISLKPFTEDIVITGIQTTKTVEDSEGNETQEAVKYGTDGYVLSIENPLIKGKEETALALIGDVLIGAHIRNFEGEHIGYPLAEFMDKAVVVDRKGNAMPTVLTDINFNFFGITTMANSAAPPLRLSSKYNSAAAQAIIAAKDLVAKEKTQRELAVEQLNKTLATSSGLYSTSEVQPDGSTIYYLHDKPTLEESQNVMKLTAEAIGFSTDGGETFPFGFTIDGDMIVRVLQTEGVNADWINTGSIVVSDNSGNVIMQADIDAGTFTVNTEYFKLNALGQLTATDGKFSGTVSASAGTIGGFTITGVKLYTEDHINLAGNYVPGVLLDTENGLISVGAGVFKSNASNESRIGLTDYYIQFVGDNTSVYKINVEGSANFRDAVNFNAEAHFDGAVQFSEMPTFPDRIPVSEGGTGRSTFAENALLLGNGSDAIVELGTQKGVLCCDSANGWPYWGEPTWDAPTLDVPTIIGARSNSVTVKANDVETVTISFGYTFSSTPAVVPSVQHNSEHNITCRLKNVETSYCEVLVTNNSASSQGVYVHIIATER